MTDPLFGFLALDLLPLRRLALAKQVDLPLGAESAVLVWLLRGR
jgi:hypothetical protein